MVKILDKRYIAGYVDADGCFLLNKQPSGTYVPLIKIVSTSEQMIRDIAHTFTSWGVYCTIHTSKGTNKCKDAWHVCVRRQIEIINLCRTLIPHLHLKAPRAELLCEWAVLRRLTERGKTTLREQEIYKEIRRLNMRGKQ